MKFRFIYTFFVLGLGAVIFSANSGGRASAAGSGNTGAPGDSNATCINCHGSGGFTVDLAITVEDGDGMAITEYIPGTTYTAKVTVTSSGSPEGYGFQLVGLNAALDENGPDLAGFSAPASNTKLANANGRQYAEHNGISSSNSFSVTWTAPAAGSGAISFYSCGNAVDGGGSTADDGADCDKITIAEGMTSSTQDLNASLRFDVNPNPAQDWIHLQFNSASTERYQLRILDA